MKALCLLASGLFSCSVFVGKVNPCFNGKPDTGAFCFERAATIQTTFSTRQIDSGDLNGDGLVDLVFLVDTSPGLALQALYQNKSGGFEPVSVPLTNSVLSFEVVNLGRADRPNDSIVALNGDLVSIVDDDGNNSLREESSSLSELTQDPIFIKPRALTVGQFLPGGPQEVAAAFLDDPETIGRVYVFSVGEALNEFIFNTGQIIGCDIPNINAIISIDANNIDDDPDSEFALLVNSNNPNTKQSVLYNNLGDSECSREITDLVRFDTVASIGNLLGENQAEFVVSETFNNQPSLLVFASSAANPLQLSQVFDFPLAAPYQTSAIGDFDGDDREDILVATEDNRLVFIYQETSGSLVVSEDFLPLFPPGPGAFPREGLHLSDINNDGVADILVSDATSQVEVFLSRP